MEITLEVIEHLTKIVNKYRLDKIKLGELEISKSRHEVSKPEKSTHNNAFLSEEDLLFYSSSAPSLTAEEIAELTDSPMPLEIPKKKNKK